MTQSLVRNHINSRKSAIFEVNRYGCLYMKMELRLLTRGIILLNSFSLCKYDTVVWEIFDAKTFLSLM